MNIESRSRILPALVALGALLWLAKVAITPADKPGGMNLQAFSRLPVVFNGRVKPYDTLARNALLVISERQSYRDKTGASRPAIRWLLDSVTRAEGFSEHKVFRIENPQVLDLLGLKPREGFRYALDEFSDKLPALERQAQHAEKSPQSQLDVSDKKILKLWNAFHLYLRIVQSHRPSGATTAEERIHAKAYFEQLAQSPLPHPVPPAKETDEWKPLMSAAVEAQEDGGANPATRSLLAITAAWAEHDVEGFNSELATYRSYLEEKFPREMTRMELEAFFNHLEPFYRCSVLYVFAFVLVCVGWLKWSRTLHRSAFWLMVVALLVHTFALGARMYLSGRPPVTNLYSSAVFVGWGCVLLGLFLEALYKIGVGNIVASAAGFVTLVIAHHLSADGDTMEMMRAVLDTNFWLAIHVVTISLGYTAAFVAGGLGALFILRGVLTCSMDSEAVKAFDRMLYGVACFALFFSFVGTVTGGLWADDSWGRFWGWDPKENGALNIVLWYALILHARPAFKLQARGTAVLAVFGNVVTVWSWFGVNQLGVGLHNYGFTDSAAFWILTFAGLQFLLIGVGLLPQKAWRSYEAFEPPSGSEGVV